MEQITGELEELVLNAFIAVPYFSKEIRVKQKSRSGREKSFILNLPEFDPG
ncbi:MAG: hypothetical protein R6X08_12810 [Desulfosalsimonadaceae bacterium]